MKLFEDGGRKTKKDPTTGGDQLLSPVGRIVEDCDISVCFPCFYLNTHFFLIIWGETAFAFVLPVPHLCPHHNQQTSVTKDGKLLPSSPCRWGDTVEQQARDTVVGASSISMWMLKALLLANIFLSSSNNQMKHFAFWALIFQASNFPGPWPPGLIRSVQSCFMPEKNSAVAV